jgi:hypothetical protein
MLVGRRPNGERFYRLAGADGGESGAGRGGSERERERERENVNTSMFTPVSGYLDQDWNPVQLEINRRIKARMAEDRQLNWQVAFQRVMASDPSLAGKNWDAFQVELSRRVKELIAKNNALDYRAAMQAVMNDDSNFSHDYGTARVMALPSPGVVEGPGVNRSADVNAEMLPLVKDKIAASDGRTSYGEALRLVLSERPDLARRYKNTL